MARVDPEFTGVFASDGPMAKMALAFAGLLLLCISPHSVPVFWADILLYSGIALIPWGLVMPKKSTDSLATRGAYITLLHVIPLFPLGGFLLIRAQQLGRPHTFLVVALIQQAAQRGYTAWRVYWDRIMEMKSSS